MSYLQKQPGFNHDLLFSKDFYDIMNDSTKRVEFVTHFVQHLMLTDQQVATYCGVGVRSWKDWFSGRREMPQNVAELFALKIQRLCNRDRNSELGICVVLSEKSDMNLSQMPISAFDKTGYLGLDIDSKDNNYALLSSMAVNFENKPYIHVVRFHRPSNKHVESWIKSNITER